MNSHEEAFYEIQKLVKNIAKMSHTNQFYRDKLAMYFVSLNIAVQKTIEKPVINSMCPTCHYVIGKQKYCPNCGQKLEYNFQNGGKK